MRRPSRKSRPSARKPSMGPGMPTGMQRPMTGMPRAEPVKTGLSGLDYNTFKNLKTKGIIRPDVSWKEFNDISTQKALPKRGQYVSVSRMQDPIPRGKVLNVMDGYAEVEYKTKGGITRSEIFEVEKVKPVNYGKGITDADLKEFRKNIRAVKKGEQLGPAGGQGPADAKDLRKVEKLIKEGKPEEARRYMNSLDTAVRDAVPTPLYDKLNDQYKPPKKETPQVDSLSQYEQKQIKKPMKAIASDYYNSLSEKEKNRLIDEQREGGFQGDIKDYQMIDIIAEEDDSQAYKKSLIKKTYDNISKKDESAFDVARELDRKGVDATAHKVRMDEKAKDTAVKNTIPDRFKYKDGALGVEKYVDTYTGKEYVVDFQSGKLLDDKGKKTTFTEIIKQTPQYKSPTISSYDTWDYKKQERTEQSVQNFINRGTKKGTRFEVVSGTTPGYYSTGTTMLIKDKKENQYYEVRVTNNPFSRSGGKYADIRSARPIGKP